MFKKLIYPLMAILIATLACSSSQPTPTPAAPAAEEPAVVVIQTPIPQPATPTPEICPPGWTAVDGECTRPFLAPIPDGCHSGNIASSDLALYPIAEDGVVYTVVTEKARTGVLLDRNIQYLIYEGLKDNQSYYSIVKFTVAASDFKFDGGGVAVKGDYYPGVLLSEWYKTADPALKAEIEGLMVLIKSNRLRLAPASDQSIAFTCPQATPTP